jgi:glycerol-3-phosphate dehydrogenase
MTRLAGVFADLGESWTERVPLPGGDFPVDGVADQVAALRRDYLFLDEGWALRLVRAYGTQARDMLGDAATVADLGETFGATLTAREVMWLMDREYARTAEDVLWRRSKLGLRVGREDAARLDAWMANRRAGSLPRAAAG